jgi:hypothetical protein
VICYALTMIVAVVCGKLTFVSPAVLALMECVVILAVYALCRKSDGEFLTIPVAVILFNFTCFLIYWFKVASSQDRIVATVELFVYSNLPGLTCASLLSMILWMLRGEYSGE